MRTASVAIILCSFALAQQPKPKDVYAKYVLVPYSMAFDELVLADALSGKLDLPEGMRLKDGKVQMQAHETKVYKDVEPSSQRLLVSAMTVFQERCKYDGDGNYFVHDAVFDRYKARLVPRHKGRLEFFAKKGSTTEFALYVWDADDGAWRYPTTLARVEAGRELPNGGKLSDVKVTIKPSGRSIEDLLAEHVVKQAK